MRTAWRMLAVGAVLAGAGGCGREETKTAEPAAKTAAPVAPRPLTQPSAEKFGLPDYSAQAKADVRREQAAELQTRVEQVKVELPAKKK